MKTETSTEMQATEHTLLICEERCFLSGIPYVYRLRAVGNELHSYFLISASAPGEEEQVSAGSDLLRAVSYFNRIVKNSVTPCTLEDVWDDLTYSEIF